MHKICIFPKRCKSLVFVKKIKISIYLFWGEMDQEKVFGEVLERKEAYLDYAQCTINNAQYAWLYAQYTFLHVRFLQSFVLRRNGSRKSVWWSSK